MRLESGRRCQARDTLRFPSQALAHTIALVGHCVSCYKGAAQALMLAKVRIYRIKLTSGCAAVKSA
jgi:hypothetical protein